MKITVPGRCHVGSEGRLRGPVSVSYNDPWPCANGTPGGFIAPARGVVLHTEVGTETGTRAWFNNPQAQASAFFSVSFDGSVRQYGPLDGWMAWSQAEGNPEWIGVEHEDDGNPAIPFSAGQIAATAQIFEATSAHFGFPLDITDNTDGHGLIYHGAGGVAWGDHPDCPGDVRKHQRPAIIAVAKAIRALPVKP